MFFRNYPIWICEIRCDLIVHRISQENFKEIENWVESLTYSELNSVKLLGFGFGVASSAKNRCKRGCDTKYSSLLYSKFLVI
jgi:hypothetical protein